MVLIKSKKLIYLFLKNYKLVLKLKFSNIHQFPSKIAKNVKAMIYTVAFLAKGIH